MTPPAPNVTPRSLPESEGPPPPSGWSVLDALTDQICVLNVSGMIIATNRAWREFDSVHPPLPRTAGQGANYFAVCEAAVGQDASLATEALQGLKAVARGDIQEFALEYPCHSTENQRWFEMRAARLIENGNASLVVTHRNVTRRIRSDELLRAQRDLLLTLSRSHNPTEVLRICLRSALQVSGMECGGVYLTDATGGLRLAASSGLSDDFLDSVSFYPPDAPNTQLVMAGKPVYAEHATLRSRFPEAERSEALRALAVIPILHEQRIVGCLNLATWTPSWPQNSSTNPRPTPPTNPASTF